MREIIDNNVDKLVSNLQGIGRSWATYGLTMSKTALETGAQTLESGATTLKNTAHYLGTVSEKLQATEIKEEHLTTKEGEEKPTT